MIARFVRDGAASPSLRALVRAGDALDLDGVLDALRGVASTRSIARGIERELVACDADVLHGSLQDKLAAQLGDDAYALSGGVDAALLLALAVRRGLRPVAYTLRPRLRNDDGRYDEHASALAIGRALGVGVIVVEATDDDFVDALPDALSALEVPLYNLHPVARLVLARRVARDGHARLVTGDGADQRCSGESGHDYLPLVAALTRAAGLVPVCPYLHPSLHELEGSVDKAPLRTLLARDLPDVASARKQPRLAPAIDLPSLSMRMIAGVDGVGQYTASWLASSLGLA